MKKLSTFNIYLESGKELIIYNTLTGGVLSLEEKYKHIYQEKKPEEFPQDLTENLELGGMIVDKNLDEVKYLQVLNNQKRFHSGSLGLTIAPTLDCNFACTYCYEKGHRYNRMSEKTKKEVISFLDKQMENRSTLAIDWYGGEPLLEIELIEDISKHIISKKYFFQAQMVTNGYLLNKDIAQRLKNINISQIQVTIDGPREVHNARRVMNTKNNEGTFDQILLNVTNSCEIVPIVIRVNVDKNNIDLIDGLLDTLDEYGLRNKVGVYLAPVDNINDSCNPEYCFSYDEFSEEQLLFYKRNFKRGYFFVNIPHCNLGMCGAVSDSCFVIDPIGDMYKCWDDIGNKKLKIGSINSDESINLPELVNWLGYTCFDEECNNCKFLPICMGGCPNKAMKNGTKDCHYLKFCCEDHIKLLKETNIWQKN